MRLILWDWFLFIDFYDIKFKEETMSSGELKGTLYVKISTSVSAMWKLFHRSIFNLGGGVTNSKAIIVLWFSKKIFKPEDWITRVLGKRTDAFSVVLDHWSLQELGLSDCLSDWSFPIIKLFLWLKGCEVCDQQNIFDLVAKILWNKQCPADPFPSVCPC